MYDCNAHLKMLHQCLCSRNPTKLKLKTNILTFQPVLETILSDHSFSSFLQIDFENVISTEFLSRKILRILKIKQEKD